MKAQTLLVEVVAALLLAGHVHETHAHGEMTKPLPRVPTATYKKDCYAGLKGAGEQELRYAPVQNLLQRKQADQPSAPTFDVMNGCRGMIYEDGQPVAELEYGKEFEVAWTIQAPHPGTMELNIVKPKKDADGKIMYEKVETLYRDDKFSVTGGDGTKSVSIPETITDCGEPGNCVLQFYWDSALAQQTYPTCADFVIKGGGGGAKETSTAATEAPVAATPSPPVVETTAAPTTATEAPATEVAGPGPAPVEPVPLPKEPTLAKKRCRVRKPRV